MACVCGPKFAGLLVFMWKSVHLAGGEKQPPNWRGIDNLGWRVTERKQKTGRALTASIIAKQSPGRLREGDVQLGFYIAAAAAIDWSRIDAARPTSVTPKITNGEFVLGSTPQYA